MFPLWLASVAHAHFVSCNAGLTDFIYDLMHDLDRSGTSLT
jgi:hypothetical protein